MTAPSDFNSIPELDATLVFRVAYDGSSYSGFAEQPGQTTVAGELRRAIETLLRRPIDLTCAGRTDAGVHAVAQFISVPVTDAELTLTRRRWLRAMDALLPKDIAVYKIVPVVPEAHARFDATSRTYKYYVTTKKDPFNHELVYKLPGRLDFEAMNEACKVLFDYIDFTSFSKLHTDVKTNNCHIQHAGWTQEGDIWVFTIRADRFLRNMVRAIVGTLLEVGRGRLTIDGFRNVIEAKDRCKAGTSVPGHALFLVDVTYPEELFPVED